MDQQRLLHDYVFQHKGKYFPKIICFVCDTDASNRKRMYCTLCSVILCTLHKDQDVLKNNCQHKFLEYFQNCSGCGTIMKQNIVKINDLDPFDETEDHVCFYETLRTLTDPQKKKYSLEILQDEYLGSVIKIIQQQPTIKAIKKAQDLFLGKQQKKVKIEEKIIEKNQKQQREQNEQD